MNGLARFQQAEECVYVYIYTHTHTHTYIHRTETRSVNTVETDTWRDISTVCIIPYQERRSLVSTPVDDSNPLRRTRTGGEEGREAFVREKKKILSPKRVVFSGFRGGGEKGRARRGSGGEARIKRSIIGRSRRW